MSVKVEREDVLGFVLASAMCSTPVAFLAFEFMLPNISFPRIGKNLLVILVMSVLTGVPAGLLNKKTSLAIMSVFVYTMVGYLLAFMFYMFPFFVYDASLSIPGLYYVAFLRFTIILVFLFVFGGIVGVVAGQYLRDSLNREETKILWSDERKS
jgi:amino acid permease